MESHPARAPERALEEIWVRQTGSAERRRESREGGADRPRRELARELGVREGSLLDRLMALGVSAETAPSFEAIPLVEVAWADGTVMAEERWRVLARATAFGLELGGPAHAQLELWLRRRPERALFEAWETLARRRRAAPATAAQARALLAGAEDVAEAAGGVLGFAMVSGAERAVLGRIRHALGPHVPDEEE